VRALVDLLGFIRKAGMEETRKETLQDEMRALTGKSGADPVPTLGVTA